MLSWVMLLVKKLYADMHHPKPVQVLYMPVAVKLVIQQVEILCQNRRCKHLYANYRKLAAS